MDTWQRVKPEAFGTSPAARIKRSASSRSAHSLSDLPPGPLSVVTPQDYHTTETMDAITAQCGIISPGGQAADSHSGAVMWRPWDTPCGQNEAHKVG